MRSTRSFRARHARRRTRQQLSIVVGVTMVLMLVAASAFGSHTFDLTSPDATQPLNDGVVVVQTSFDEATGTGIFDSFVRLQKTGDEHGYNTSGALEFDEKGSDFTRDLRLGEIPIVDDPNSLYDGMRELRLDINQVSGGDSAKITLDAVRIVIHDQANFTNANLGDPALGTGGSLVWDLDAAGDVRILLDYDLAPGSGKGDMFMYLPTELFDNHSASCGGPGCFVTLYSAFGQSDPEGTFPSNDGFEEWSVRKVVHEVLANKTADTTFTRTFPWDITKSVTPASWSLFDGDTGTSEYTVSVTKGTAVDSDFEVTGSLTIANPTFETIRVTNVVDEIEGVGNATVTCPVTLNTSAADVAPGGSLVCTYEASLPDATERTNTVTFSYKIEGKGQTQTVEAMELVQFDTQNPTTVVHDTITVTDSVEGLLGSTSTSKDFVYSTTFDCDDEGDNPNTATIVETNQSDDANVAVTCYELSVSKDADTSFTRTWTWDIDKSADQTSLTLAEGQKFEVNYDVVVSATHLDSDWAVEGTITISNPAPMAAELTAVTDMISPAIAGTVDCPSMTVPANDSLECTYSADLPDATTRTNTATATQQNHDYDKTGAATASGTTDYTGQASVDFANADMTEVDECVDVNDTNVGFLDTVCATDLDANGEYLFEYSLFFGTPPNSDVVLECGDNEHRNVADFETNDTMTTGDDDAVVTPTVECIVGCTLTQGYWKTHNESFWGGAPADDTWLLLGTDAELTPFFLSGQSYFDVMWTKPKGNVYYNLARQYIAAELNQLNDADIPADVLQAFDDATALFEQYTPDEIGALKGKPSDKELRNQFVELAEILTDYNEGVTGPGHCDEDANSAN